MKTTDSIDAARLELLLTDLRLPAVKLMWKKLAEQSDKEGWPAAVPATRSGPRSAGSRPP
jgi:hypothetical protein